jgi:ribose 5-phosphate isomerase B
VRIAIAADHAGYRLKEAIKRAVGTSCGTLDDLGTDSEAPVDYPDIAAVLAARVTSGLCDRGILVCGTGIGMSMAANKFAGIRAANAWTPDTARLAREHNDANVLALGARLLPEESAVALVRVFLGTPFAGGRHQQRVEKLNALGRRQDA